MLTTFRVREPIQGLALHTAGWPVQAEIMKHPDTGHRDLSFRVLRDPVGANAVINAWSDRERGKNLQVKHPDHPFLAALHALETLAALHPWLAGKTRPPALLRTHGPLMRMVADAPPAYDVMQHVWTGGEAIKPAVRVTCIRFAAALLVCGFPCWPQVQPPGNGQPASLIFPAGSLTLPGLTHEILAQHVRTLNAGEVITSPLPGYAIGEHPFDYSHMAAINAAGMEEHLIRPAEKNPTLFFKGPGTGGVVCSQSLLEESNPNAYFRDRAHEFLSGRN